MCPLQRKIPLFLLFALCSLSQCTTTEDEIYHIVTTVGEDASTGVTVNYHCSRADSYVLVTGPLGTSGPRRLNRVDEQ